MSIYQLSHFLAKLIFSCHPILQEGEFSVVKIEMNPFKLRNWRFGATLAFQGEFVAVEGEKTYLNDQLRWTEQMLKITLKKVMVPNIGRPALPTPPVLPFEGPVPVAGDRHHYFPLILFPFPQCLLHMKS